MKDEGIAYTTVEEALQALKAKPGVSLSTTKPDNWVIATESGASIQWSFTPPGHYAHPAVVRREVKQKDNDVYVETQALCHAEKVSCDRLIVEFKQLNERMRKTVQSRLKDSRSE
ncbi:hypothetical protein [Caldimonas brevitalea]|uniref:Uncharacterized protein n=1 Tax=Caldimonas brevitalea TaxID=413882 RepID=A0A0G3BKI2_9BURK|nr:hypothetical protein [Caldimonas brevitalea]AKJ27055.1 hypothetical protein AAW51_0364 [Caldimonas brevitalea]